MYPRRITVIMSKLKDNVLKDGRGLIPYLISKNYIPKGDYLFHDMNTLEELERFGNYWLEHDSLNLAQALLSSKSLRPTTHSKAPGLWIFQDEVEWVINKGIIEPRDIIFFKVASGTVYSIAELPTDKLESLRDLTGDNSYFFKSAIMLELLDRK